MLAKLLLFKHIIIFFLLEVYAPSKLYNRLYKETGRLGSAIAEKGQPLLEAFPRRYSVERPVTW